MSLFQDPVTTPVNAQGDPYAGAKRYFYLAGTLTPATVYADAARTTPLSNPVVANASGQFVPIFLDPAVSYRTILRDSAEVLLRDNDNINASTVTAQTVGAVLYPRTSLEISSSITPTDYTYPPGNVRRYGADNTGVTSSSVAIQNAINTGHDVVFPAGSYLAQGLTQTLDFQRLKAEGNVRVIKNANGPILTCSGDDIELNGIGFRGDAASPTFTGDGVVISGDNPRIYNCGVRWISGTPLLCTGSSVQIDGTCDIYQTTDGTSNGYDIVIGVSGTATLYHRIKGIRTSQATGGIRFIDTGSPTVSDSQFGKLFVDAGTSPAGVNGGNYTGNRILGNVTVELSSSTFAGNTFGAVTVVFGAGTSGHSFDGSNTIASGATITDNSTNSVIVDLRAIPLTAYTPTWTAASSNPAIGDGTLTGFVSKEAKRVTASVRIVMGGTTTYGTGVWFVGLPHVPTTSVPFIGSVVVLDNGTGFHVGSCQTLTDGTARMILFHEAGADQFSPTIPITWASGDELRATVTYYTA